MNVNFVNRLLADEQLRAEYEQRRLGNAPDLPNWINPVRAHHLATSEVDTSQEDNTNE